MCVCCIIYQISFCCLLFLRVMHLVIGWYMSFYICYIVYVFIFHILYTICCIWYVVQLQYLLSSKFYCMFACRVPTAPHGMVHVPYSQDGLDGLIAIGCHFYSIDSRHKVCQSVCEECIATLLVAELVAGTYGLLKRWFLQRCRQLLCNLETQFGDLYLWNFVVV